MDGPIADVFVILLLWGLQLTFLKEINCTKLEYLIPTRTTLSPPDGALIVNPTTKIVAVQFPNNALHCKIFNLRKQIDVFYSLFC